MISRSANIGQALRHRQRGMLLNPYRFAAVASGPPATNLLEQWKLNTGLTQAGGFASAWLGQVGGNSLDQATGAKQPAVQGDGSLLLDGLSMCMQAIFTLNQPCTIVLLMKQKTWLNDRYFFDGGNQVSGVVVGSGSTPQIVAYAGSVSGASSDLAVDTWGVVSVCFNGASSYLQVNGNAPITGDFEASNMGGFTLGGRANQSGNLSNIQAGEILIYNAALGAPALADAITYMQSVPVA